MVKQGRAKFDSERCQELILQALEGGPLNKTRLTQAVAKLAGSIRPENYSSPNQISAMPRSIEALTKGARVFFRKIRGRTFFAAKESDLSEPAASANTRKSGDTPKERKYKRTSKKTAKHLKRKKPDRAKKSKPRRKERVDPRIGLLNAISVAVTVLIEERTQSIRNEQAVTARVLNLEASLEDLKKQVSDLQEKLSKEGTQAGGSFGDLSSPELATIEKSRKAILEAVRDVLKSRAARGGV